MEIRNLIFDFDGTLVDTAGLIIATMQQTIRELGLPQRSEAECRAMIGYRLHDIPPILWPGIPDIADAFAETYHRVFDTLKVSFKVQMYPEVFETLSLFYKQGINMAIATSRNLKSLKQFNEDFGIDSYFKILIGGQEVVNGKPDPEPVNRILDSMGWNPEETLVVGDMNVDILMGSRAGTKTCGVTYGNGTIKELEEAGADYIINSFGDLQKLVQVIS
ncbi:MAG: HAD-IA family hydrolase [Muribaculaceae bacterium]|nr:HAD-IA family hydrolase [Muribaculaceae bacterium]